MSLKLKKLAVATAAAISMGVAGQAQSSELLFPYVAVGSTVTTLVSVINTNTYRGGGAQELHYVVFFKEGNGAAPGNTDQCQKMDRMLPTSPNDIQTFDIGGKLDNTMGVVFNDPSIRNNWQGAGQSFAMLANRAEPVRAYLVVDDVARLEGNPRGNMTAEQIAALQVGDGPVMNNDLFGEAFVIEFGSGAVWGYQASNVPSGVARAANGELVSVVDGWGHRNALSGVAMGFFPAAADQHRWVMPTALLPQSQANTRFFVTPLTANMRDGNGNRTATVTATGVTGNAFVRVQMGPMGSGQTSVYDRDEVPYSGTNAQRVHCVGAVNALSTPGSVGLVSQIILDQIAAANSDIGWGYLSAFGEVFNAATQNYDAASSNVAASVIKLEFGENSQFLGRNMGTFNNAFQLNDARLTSRASTLGNRQIGRTAAFAFADELYQKDGTPLNPLTGQPAVLQNGIFTVGIS